MVKRQIQKRSIESFSLELQNCSKTSLDILGCHSNRSRHFWMLSSWCSYKLFVFALIMVSAPVSFPVPQMQGLDEREALDCFILDYRIYSPISRDPKLKRTDDGLKLIKENWKTLSYMYKPRSKFRRKISPLKRPSQETYVDC